MVPVEEMRDIYGPRSVDYLIKAELVTAPSVYWKCQQQRAMKSHWHDTFPYEDKPDTWRASQLYGGLICSERTSGSFSLISMGFPAHRNQ